MIVLILCLLAENVLAFPPGFLSTATHSNVSTGGSYDDIIFWWRAESSTLGTGDYPTSGITPTVDFDDGSGYTAGAMVVGTYGLELKEWDKITWSLSTVNQSTFRVGFWIEFKSLNDGYGNFYIKGTTDDYVLVVDGTDELRLYGPWGDLATTTANVVINTPYYIEFYVDDTNNIVKLYIDNVEKASYTSEFSGFGAITGVQIGGNFGNVSFDLDNFAISNNVSRNLYSLRNNTSSPR